MPQGATPRSLTVHLRGELTRQLKPGAAVTVAGVFLPEPYTGFRAMRAGLLTSTYLEAQQIEHMKESYRDLMEKQAAQDRIQVHALAQLGRPCACGEASLLHVQDSALGCLDPASGMRPAD